MKLTDHIVNFGKEIAFTDIFNKLKNGNTVTIFCPSRPVMKMKMDGLERDMRGDSLSNYSTNQILYKKGSATFYIVPEILLKPKIILNMKTDFYCNLCDYES